MTDNQQFIAAVSATVVPSFAVLVGILLNNARLNDLRTDMNTRFAELRADIDKRFSHVDAQLLMLAKLFDAQLGRVSDRDAERERRLAALERR